MSKSQWAFYRGLLVGIIVGAMMYGILVPPVPPQMIKLEPDIPSDALTLEEMGICPCSICQSMVWIDGKWTIPMPTQRQQCGSWVTTTQPKSKKKTK